MENKKSQEELIKAQNPQRPEDVKPQLPKEVTFGKNKSGYDILPKK